MIGDLDHFWHRLEVRHLVALEAVLRLGSFRAAARALGYSQSAISEQIASLEAIVGARIVERSPGARLVRPTDEGAILLRCAGRVGDALAGCRADLSASTAGGEVLRVGIFPSASVRLLPPIVQALRIERPRLQLVLAESIDPEELFTSVAAGDLDVAFGSPTPAPATLEAVTLFDDPYVLLVAADHPLSSEAAVHPAKAAQLPLVGYRSLRPELMPLSQLPHPERHNVVFRTDDDPTVHALVAAGIGVAVVPRLSVNPVDHTVRAIRIEPPIPPRSITLAWLHGRAPTEALNAFVAAARVVALRSIDDPR
jgi:DNA-binding transcriptional LysR family regulator